MVRMHMGDQHAHYRQAFKIVFEYFFPLSLDLGTGNAAVHDGPTFTTFELVAEQPHVHVIEGKGKRQADPFHPLRYGKSATRFRQSFTKGVLKPLLIGIHSGLHHYWRQFAWAHPYGIILR